MKVLLKGLDARLSAGLTGVISVANYYFILFVLAALLDFTGGSEGAPATMLMAFVLGPGIAIILGTLTWALLKRFQRQKRWMAGGIIRLLHFALLLFFIASLIYIFSTDDF